MDFDLIKSVGGEDLENDWKKLFNTLGVDSFEGLEQLDKGFGKKDVSKLIPVKKQVTKDGKSYMTTVYVSPDEAKEMKRNKKIKPEKQAKVKAKEEQKQEKKKAKQEAKDNKAKAKLEALKNKPNKTPKDHKKIFEAEIVSPYNDTMKELQDTIKQWKIDSEKQKQLLEATKDHYFVTAKAEDGEIGAVGAFKRNKDRLVMSYFASVKKLKGAGMRIIKKLVEKSASMGLGVEINPPKGSHDKLIAYGFRDELEGTLVMDAETVKEKIEGKTKEAKEKATEKEAEKPEDNSKEAEQPEKEAEKEPKEEKADQEKAPEKEAEQEPKEKEVEKEADTKKEEAPEREEKTHETVKKELRDTRKKLGTAQYIELLKHHGISWEENSHKGINTMRASMAAAQFIKDGGTLNIDEFVETKEAVDSIYSLNESHK